MLDKCLNPECSQPFLYLHSGRLFRFGRKPPLDLHDPDPADALGRNSWEFFWLCDICAGRFTLRMQPDGNVELVARPANKTVPPPEEKRKSA